VKVVAHRLNLEGEGIYQVPLDASDHGLVIEVNASTAYLYITNRDFSEIFDALHLYDRDTADELQNGESVFVVWRPNSNEPASSTAAGFRPPWTLNDTRRAAAAGFRRCQTLRGFDRVTSGTMSS
jgi:hypothetical protein